MIYIKRRLNTKTKVDFQVIIKNAKYVQVYLNSSEYKLQTILSVFFNNNNCIYADILYQLRIRALSFLKEMERIK